MSVLTFKLAGDLAGSGDRAARRLVAEIIRFAKARGDDQGALAARAGISGEILSRLKRSGGGRLATVLALARAAGFKTLELTEQSAGHVAASLAARKLSAGRRLPIAADELVLALRTGSPQGGHRAHLYGFFEELPIELVHDTIMDEGLDYAHLARLAREFGAEGETIDWLAEMAGDRLAYTA